jgi:hypothetical protein
VRWFGSVGAALLAGALVAAPARSAPRALALEGSYERVVTRIPVKLSQRISSQDARAGDTFAFETTASVLVDARFLPAGTHGHGIVVAAKAARGPQPGALTLEARSLDPAGGPSIPVGLAPGELARRIAGDVRSFGVPVGPVPVRVGGDRETNVVYDAGTSFVVIAPPPPTPEPLPSSAAG